MSKAEIPQKIKEYGIQLFLVNWYLFSWLKVVLYYIDLSNLTAHVKVLEKNVEITPKKDREQEIIKLKAKFNRINQN